MASSGFGMLLVNLDAFVLFGRGQDREVVLFFLALDALLLCLSYTIWLFLLLLQLVDHMIELDL